MNVLVMADYRTRNSGNFIASLLELAERMRERHDGVLFMFPDNGKGGYSWTTWLEQNGFSVRLFNANRPEDEILADLKNIVSENHIDLVHSHFGYCHKYLVKNRRALGNVQVLIHDHMGYAPEGSLAKQRIRSMLYAARYRSKKIGVASVWKKKDEDYWLCGKQLHWYVPNGLSLKRNLSQSLSKEAIREIWNIQDDEKVCLLLGWDMYRKGLDVAIKAIGALQAQGQNVHLGVVGLGTKSSEQTSLWIREKTNADPNCGWIHYLDSTEDIFAYYRAADVFLSTSRAEGFPYAVMEAISQRATVVMSDIDATQWANGYSKGFVYPVEDVEACANAINNAISVEKADVDNGKDVMKQYSIDIWCERIMAIYHQMLEK